jgi:hypothetical protein
MLVGNQDAVQLAASVDLAQLLNLIHQKGHTPNRKCIQLCGNNHAVGSCQSRHTGSRKARRTVNQHDVVTVVLNDVVPQILNAADTNIAAAL